MVLLMLLLILVVSNPMSDAMKDNGNKRRQKNFELLREFATWGMLYVVTESWTFVICGGLAYLFFRTALHNLFYNIIRGLPWYYTGTTSWSDDVEKRFDKKWVLTARIICFVFACLLFYLAVNEGL